MGSGSNLWLNVDKHIVHFTHVTFQETLVEYAL